jgi:hypothetical protein
MPRLSRQREDEIIRAYEAYEPHRDGSIEALAKRCGTTKQTMYAVLHRRGIATRSERATRSTRDSELAQTDLIERAVVRSLQLQQETLDALHGFGRRLDLLEKRSTAA